MINHEKQRFYWLSIQEDIFGQWCVVKVYGGINNKHSREIWEPYESRILASQRMFDIENVRRKRGYVYTHTKTPDDYILTPEIITITKTSHIK